MIRAIVALMGVALMALLASGCTETAPPPAAPAASASAPAGPAGTVMVNPTDARLSAVAPAERATLLGKGIGCPVTTSFRMGMAISGPVAGNAYWSLRCADGREFAVEIRPDAVGTSMALDCRTLAARTKFRCFASM